MRLGSAGIAGAALLGAGMIMLGRRNYTDAPELGISPDNTAIQNRDAFLALSNTDEYVSLPAGDYLFDNTPPEGTYAPTIAGFSGGLLFEDGARIVFTDNVEAGLCDPSRLAFDFENNARVDGRKLHVTDDQISPTGNMVKAHGEQTGNLGTVDDSIENGEVLIENPSGLNFTLA